MTGTPGPFGVTIFPATGGSGNGPGSSGYTNITSAISAWQGLILTPIGATVGVRKTYNADAGQAEQFSASNPPGNDIWAAAELGETLIVCYKPTFSSSSPWGVSTETTSMVTSLLSIINPISSIGYPGIPASRIICVIWQEVTNGGAGYPTSTEYWQLVNFHQAGIRTTGLGISGYPGVRLFHEVTRNSTIASKWFPGPPNLPSCVVDGYLVDWYANNKLAGHYPAGDVAIAVANNIPFGFGEIGNLGAAGGQTASEEDMEQYLVGDPVNSIFATLNGLLKDGYPTAPTAWYQSNNSNQGPFTFIATHSSPCLFTASGSSFVDGWEIVLSGSGLPGGFTAGPTYYVTNVSGDQFNLAATPGGQPVPSTSASSGSPTLTGNGPNNILSSSDYRIPWLQLIAGLPAVGAGPAVVPPTMLPGNILTPADSDLEAGTGTPTWAAASNATVATSGLQSFSGLSSLAVSAASTGSAVAAQTGYYLCQAGVPIIASAYAFNGAGTGRTAWLEVAFYNGSTLLSSVSSTVENLAAGGWAPLAMATVTPANTTQIVLQAWWSGATAAGESTYFDLFFLAAPLYQVLVSWGAEPFSTTPQWSDVTPWIRADQPGTWTHGRQDNISEVQPGTLSLTADNTGGWLTPGLSSSPWYPNVKIGRRIQVNVPDEAGTWHTRFDGQISEGAFTPAPTGLENTVAITANDCLAFLGRQIALSCWTKQEILSDGPALHWTLDDPTGARLAAETSGNGGPPLRIHNYGSGTLTFAGGDSAQTDVYGNSKGQGVESQYWGGLGTTATLESVYMAQQAGGSTSTQGNIQLQTALPFTITTGAGQKWSAEVTAFADVPNFAVYASSVGYTFYALALSNTRTGEMVAIGLQGGSTREMFGRYYTNYSQGNLYNSVTASPSLFGNVGPWVLAITISGASGGATVKFYMTYLPETGSTPQLIGSFTLPKGAEFNWITVGGPLGGQQGWLGNLSCASIFNELLPTSRMAVHSQVAYAGYQYYLPGQVIGSLAGYAGLPSFWGNLGAAHTGATLLDYFDITGSNALSGMQQAEAADQGLLYVNQAGQLSYAGREVRMGSGTPALTLQAGQYEPDLGAKVNDQYLLNTAAFGSAALTTGVAAANAQSLDDYGPYPKGTVQSPTQIPAVTYAHWHYDSGDMANVFQTDNLAFAAQWAANSTAQPVLKCASLRVDALTVENLALSQLYAIDVNSVIAADGMPVQFPDAPHATEYFTEGITETIQGGESPKHDIVFNTSPASWGRAWIAGDPVYGQLDNTAMIGVSAPAPAAAPAYEVSGGQNPGAPYYPPSYSSSMNATGYVGGLDQAGIWALLQQQLTPPMFAAGRAVTGMSVGAGTTANPLQIDSVFADTFGGYAALSGWPNWYFVPVPGWWQLHACVPFPTNGTGYRHAHFQVVQQALVGDRGGFDGYNVAPSSISANGSVPDVVHISTKIYLTLGAAVSVWIWQDSGGSLATLTSNGGAIFTGRFLGDTAVQD